MALGLWIGAWSGVYLLEEGIWPRFYHPDGSLALLRAEAAEAQATQERERAQVAEAQAAQERERTQLAEAQAAQERERVQAAEARIAELEAQLRRLGGKS